MKRQSVQQTTAELTETVIRTSTILGTASAIRSGMLTFFRRDGDRLSCETRLNPHGRGFQLVIVENDDSRIEDFVDLPRLLSREDDLLRAWRSRGWRDVGRNVADVARNVTRP